MKKTEFVQLLKNTIAAIESDDSFQGRIAYEVGEAPDTFNVDAFVRVGNSMGLSGCIVVQEKLTSFE